MKTLEDALVRSTAAQSKSVNEVAGKLGVHYSVARRELDRLGLHLVDHTRDADPDAPPELSEAELLKMLKAKGYHLDKDTTASNKQWKVLPKIEQVGPHRRFKFGWVTDTHFCSKYQQLTHLHRAYQEMKEDGVEVVLHDGDATSGNGHMYRGQEYEIFAHGLEEQEQYLVDAYPSVTGMTTHFIGGNHDLTWKMSAGYDIVEHACGRRDDFEYLGMYGAQIEIDGIRIYVHHGDGGVAYARSYKMQKIIEQMSPENKPHIYLGGHYHITCELKNYRNVFGNFGGCFEAQTPYLLRKGLHPEIGYHIVTVKVDDAGLRSVSAEWRPFFVPMKSDF